MSLMVLMDIESGVVSSRRIVLHSTIDGAPATIITSSSWEYYFWRFLWLVFHYSFLSFLGALVIISYVSADVWYVAPLMYLPVAIYATKLLVKLYFWIAMVLQMLDRAKFASNLTAAILHEYMAISAKHNRLLELIISLHACSFIAYLRAVAGGDRSHLIKLLSILFSKTAFGFYYNGDIFGSICFTAAACVAILALVINKGRRPSEPGMLDQVLEKVGGDLEETPAEQNED